MKSMFWTNENLSLMVAWSSSVSISCCKSSLEHYSPGTRVHMWPLQTKPAVGLKHFDLLAVFYSDTFRADT